jgi:hypothetical protein
MDSFITVTITAIRRKVSGKENVYHLISFKESVQPKNETGIAFNRVWNNVFYPNDIATNTKEDLIGTKAELHVIFYPTERKKGEQTFASIECHIEDVKQHNEIG